jgi:hypothetical protein
VTLACVCADLLFDSSLPTRGVFGFVLQTKKVGRFTRLSLLLQPSIVWLIRPMSVMLWQWDRYASHEGGRLLTSTNARVRCGLCHMEAQAMLPAAGKTAISVSTDRQDRTLRRL